MRRWVLVALASATAGAGVAACQDPTEITVRITTGESCANFTGAAITTGPSVGVADERYMTGFIATTTDHCDASGFIGTLVITPGEKSGSVIVAAGVRDPKTGNPQDPTMCNTNPESCIVAKRSFSFESHRALVLPITLDPRCLGKTCDPGSTCYQGGCIDEAVTCSGEQCGLPPEMPGGTGMADASASSDGAYDADVTDGSMTTSDDGSMMTMADGGSDGTVVDSGTDSAAGLPACTTAMMGASGNGWIATCDVNGGHGVNTCTGGAPPFCCHCACIDMNGNGHGSITCGSTTLCGSGCMN